MVQRLLGHDRGQPPQRQRRRPRRRDRLQGTDRLERRRPLLELRGQLLHLAAGRRRACRAADAAGRTPLPQRPQLRPRRTCARRRGTWHRSLERRRRDREHRQGARDRQVVRRPRRRRHLLRPAPAGHVDARGERLRPRDHTTFGHRRRRRRSPGRDRPCLRRARLDRRPGHGRGRRAARGRLDGARGHRARDRDGHRRPLPARQRARRRVRARGPQGRVRAPARAGHGRCGCHHDEGRDPCRLTCRRRGGRPPDEDQGLPDRERLRRRRVELRRHSDPRRRPGRRRARGPERHRHATDGDGARCVPRRRARRPAAP